VCDVLNVENGVWKSYNDTYVTKVRHAFPDVPPESAGGVGRRPQNPAPALDARDVVAPV